VNDVKRIKAAFYRAASGAEPVRAWLLGMDDKGRRAIGYDIATAEFGWLIGMPTCRPMGHGLYEIRSNLAGNTISRVFFCVAEGQMVLLHGMIKKTQATPKTDLDLARKRMKEVSP
jgi:phage-related protein